MRETERETVKPGRLPGSLGGSAYTNEFYYTSVMEKTVPPSTIQLSILKARC